MENNVSLSQIGFVRHRHTALLAVLAAAFGVRPLIGESPVSHLAFSIAMILMLMVAIYTIQVDELVGEREVLLAERRKISIAGWTLALLAIGERMFTIVIPHAGLSFAAPVSWLLFSSFITWNELRAVLRQKVVTRETISMSISVYLLFGLTWGFLYILIFQRHPDAFSFPAAAPIAHSRDQLSSAFPVLIYFSLITLTTVGYGDITPVSLQARYAATAEAITGQFYLAILVARLVAMQISGPAGSGVDANAKSSGV